MTITFSTKVRLGIWNHSTFSRQFDNLKIVSILLSAFVEVGGYEKLIENYFEARASNRSYVDPSNETMGTFCDSSKSSDCCGEVKEHSMHLFRSAYPGDSDLPWTGIRKYYTVGPRLL